MDPTIVIVDPDDCTRRSLAWLLESVNLRVSTFASTQAFFAAPEKRTDGCMLFDLGFPQQGGVEEYNNLIAPHVQVPVIVLSTDDSTAGPFEVEPFACLSKPFSDRELADCIRRALVTSAAPMFPELGAIPCW